MHLLNPFVFLWETQQIETRIGRNILVKRLGQKDFDFRNSLLWHFKIDRLDKKANKTEFWVSDDSFCSFFIFKVRLLSKTRTNSHIIRITISSFINGYLKKLRKRLLKKSHSSKIGLTTIIKNAWTTSLPENFLLLTNLKFSVYIWTTSLTQRCFLMSIIN